MAGNMQTSRGTGEGVSHFPGPDGGAEGAARPGRRGPLPAPQSGQMSSDRKHHGAGRRMVILALAVGIALLASGCGGGSTSAGSGASSGADKGQDKMLAYSQCIRSHGVPKFPDPGSNGQLSVNGNALGVSPAVLQAAMQACHKLAGGQSGQSSPQNATQALKFTQCIRSHGEPNFPDPNSDGTFVISPSSGINTQSPVFQAAEQTCKSVEPPDLSMTESGKVPA
jgi:hypothetical protein